MRHRSARRRRVGAAGAGPLQEFVVEVVGLGGLGREAWEPTYDLKSSRSSPPTGAIWLRASHARAESSRFQPGTVAMRLTSPHLAWCGGLANSASRGKSALTKVSTRR